MSVTTDKLYVLVCIDFEPMGRMSILSLFNLKKIKGNKESMSSTESVNEDGGKVILSLLMWLSWMLSAYR